MSSFFIDQSHFNIYLFTAPLEHMFITLSGHTLIVPLGHMFTAPLEHNRHDMTEYCLKWR